MNNKMRIGLAVILVPIAAMILIGIMEQKLFDDYFMSVFWIAFPTGTGLLVWGFLDLMRGPRKLLASGMPAVAVIEEVRRTGSIVNEVHLVVELCLRVEPEGKPAYRAVVKTLAPIHQPDLFTPGQRVPVRYDPAKPARVAIDPDPPADWLGRAGRPTRSPVTQEEILASGSPAVAQIVGLKLTGKTAGQLAGADLEHPERSAYPAIIIELVVQPEREDAFAYQAVYAVPPERAVGLTRDTVVPVRYLRREGHTLVAVDWERLPLAR